MPSLTAYRPTLRDVEIAAVVFAFLAGVYGIATTKGLDLRFAIVLLAPTVEAALPLLARRFWPAKVRGARFVALLLVAFFIALAPVGIDSYLYLPCLLALAVVLFLANRQRWRDIREQRVRGQAGGSPDGSGGRRDRSSGEGGGRRDRSPRGRRRRG